MNDTSIVTMPKQRRSAGSDSRVSVRALTRSMTMTRGSLRIFQSSWPCPTSSATTRAAPRCSITSVNPPVEAPMSSPVRPVTAIAKVSSACASFTPPRPT